MKDTKAPHTGMIPVGEQTVTFYLDAYIATFMGTDHQRHQFNKDDKFIFGRTHRHYGIAIYKGDLALSCSGAQKLTTSAYMIAADNALSIDWSGFDYIQFSGGTLNKLFFCNALKKNSDDPSAVSFLVQDDRIRINLTINGCDCELIVGSDIREHFGINGRVISNDRVMMGLKFSEKQPLADAFKHITKMKELLAIMAFRSNVGFDEITLFHNDRHISKMQVYIKENREFTEKDAMKNLMFYEMKDSIPALISILYGSKENKPSYEIGFLPSSDKDFHFMDNNKVRLICSALECELTFINDLQTEEDAHLQELIKSVKDMVKKHRDSENKLQSKTYDVIFPSIDHWSMSASDKICLLFHRFEQEMLTLNPSDIHIGNKEIEEFVKYRNRITHGSWRVLNNSIAITAHVLQGLVYCCLLTRIGMSREIILNLCQAHRILR